jgi:hypothetical protein
MMWADYLERLRQNWKRDLVALPIVVLLCMLGTGILFPDITLVGRFWVSIILGMVSWPIGHWVVDYTIRRR